MSPLDLKFVTVVGKGGVGKSTVSAALAMAAAEAGKRVLVAMCNSRERLSGLLEVEPIGPEIRNVLPGIDAVNMEPGAALEEYGMMILKVRSLYKVIFENRFVSSFLRGTPGLDAWAMLGKAQYHAFETTEAGRDRYDMVILDAPATGHGLDLLRVPSVILDVVPPGPLRKDAEKAWELFCDPTKSGVVLVTLAEELPANETIELDRAIRTELGLPVNSVVINRVLQPLLHDQPAILERLKAAADSADLKELSHLTATRAGRETIQQECIARLTAAIDVPQTQLPVLTTSQLGRKDVAELADALVAD